MKRTNRKARRRAITAWTAGSGHKKTLDLNSGPVFPKCDLTAMHANSTAGQIASPKLAEVDVVMLAAQKAGWKGRDCFHAALLMLSAGATVAGAEAAFSRRCAEGAVIRPTLPGYLRALAKACEEAASRAELLPVVVALLRRAPATVASLAEIAAPRVVKYKTISATIVLWSR
jgi:hypothetical protein